MGLIGFKSQSFCHNEIKNGFRLEAYYGKRIRIYFHRESYLVLMFILFGEKGKVLYGQEFPSGESTIPLSLVAKYQLLAVIQLMQPKWPTPSCSQPEPATDNGVRDRSN